MIFDQLTLTITGRLPGGHLLLKIATYSDVEATLLFAEDWIVSDVVRPLPHNYCGNDPWPPGFSWCTATKRYKGLEALKFVDVWVDSDSLIMAAHHHYGNVLRPGPDSRMFHLLSSREAWLHIPEDRIGSGGLRPPTYDHWGMLHDRRRPLTIDSY